MTAKESIDIAWIIKENYIEPIKGQGRFEVDNAMFFIQDFLRRFPQVANHVRELSIDSNGNAGDEFLNEIGIR